MSENKNNYNIFIYNSSKKANLPKKKVSHLLDKVLIGESIVSASINVVYVNNDEILSLNKQYLNHDYYTDVITFSLTEEDESQKIDGEVYICVDVAEEQAKDYKVSLTNEILRLAIHGCLHLCGYDDKDEESKSKMRQLENFYLGIN